MKRLIFSIMITSLVAATGVQSLHAAQEDEAREIVRKMDRLYRSDTSHGQVEMTIVSPHWERTLRLEVWSEGMDKTFILINYPKKDKDIATLRIENEMWNYLPKINKVMKVPPSMMMSSWMGSDFTNDDLVKESSMLEDYRFSLLQPKDAKPDMYYVELIPREDKPIVWDRIVLVVRKSDYLPVREEFFDEKGRMVRIMEFKDIRELGGRKLPATIELIPLTEEGKKTVVTYTEMEFDRTLPPEVFTLRNLQRKR